MQYMYMTMFSISKNVVIRKLTKPIRLPNWDSLRWQAESNFASSIDSVRFQGLLRILREATISATHTLLSWHVLQIILTSYDNSANGKNIESVNKPKFCRQEHKEKLLRFITVGYEKWFTQSKVTCGQGSSEMFSKHQTPLKNSFLSTICSWWLYKCGAHIEIMRKFFPRLYHTDDALFTWIYLH
jgi:hypothetical protein